MPCEYIWSVQLVFQDKTQLIQRFIHSCKEEERDFREPPAQHHHIGHVHLHGHLGPATWTADATVGLHNQRISAPTVRKVHRISSSSQPHVAGICIMETENIPVLARPAHSPDMSPTEHVCDALEPHDMFQSLPYPAASHSPWGPTEWTEILVFPCLFKHKTAHLTVAFYCADIIKQSSLCHHSEWGLALCKSPFNTFKTFSSSVIIIRTSESTIFSISNLFCVCCLSMTLCWPHWNLDSYQPCRLI